MILGNDRSAVQEARVIHKEPAITRELWMKGQAKQAAFTELRDRDAALKPLLATNASLATVEAVVGHIPVYKRGTEGWTQLHKSFSATNASEMDRKIAAKIERSAAIGFTSTISMKTIIFLDEQDRLIDYVVDSQ